MSIRVNRNIISVSGSLGILDFRYLIDKIYSIIQTQGLQHVTLNFTRCASAFQGPMLALCAHVLVLRNKGIKFALVLPEIHRLARLFENTGWANLIDPARFTFPKGSSPGGRVPVKIFQSAADQQDVVRSMIDGVLRSTNNFSREHLSAIEWAISEITDNVLVHSNSPIGGLAQMMILSESRQIEYAVSDAGLGIPKTLRSAFPQIQSDSEALDQAIREGVTRDKSIGQGNGLYGSFQISRVSGGFFHLHSGRARLDFDQHNEFPRMNTMSTEYSGTLVAASIDISKPDILAKALRFGDQRYQPMDSIEYRYEQRDSSEIVLLMKDQSSSFGSRVAGTPLRKKFKNLIELSTNRRLTLDFSGITMISSSFADEVFGKMCLEFGPIAFARMIQFRHLNENITRIIDRAIVQRLSPTAEKDGGKESS